MKNMIIGVLAFLGILVCIAGLALACGTITCTTDPRSGMTRCN